MLLNQGCIYHVCRAVFTGWYLPGGIYRAVFTGRYLPGGIYRAVFTGRYVPGRKFTGRYLPVLQNIYWAYFMIWLESILDPNV